MKIGILDTKEYNPYYGMYINKVGDRSLLDGLRDTAVETKAFLEAIPSDKHDFAYAEGKWTIKELLLHLVDAERIFTYRALRFARKDKTPVPGFEQDDYVTPSKAGSRSMASLIAEFEAVRKATILLFESFDDEMLESIGEASGSDMSVRAIGFVTIGHAQHHIDVIKERYL